MHVYLILD